jgi:hypothetical protein
VGPGSLNLFVCRRLLFVGLVVKWVGVRSSATGPSDDRLDYGRGISQWGTSGTGRQGKERGGRLALDLFVGHLL